MTHIKDELQSTIEQGSSQNEWDLISLLKKVLCKVQCLNNPHIYPTYTLSVVTSDSSSDSPSDMPSKSPNFVPSNHPSKQPSATEKTLHSFKTSGTPSRFPLLLPSTAPRSLLSTA